MYNDDKALGDKCPLLFSIFLHGEVQLEFCWQFIFRVQSVGEVNSADSAVGMNLDSQSLDVVGAIGSAGEVRQVELDLIPAVIQTHGHCTDEGLDSRCTLVVASTESPPHILVIQDLNFKCKVFLQVLDDHN